MKKANNMKMIDKSELEKQVQLEESIDESKQSFNVSIHSKRQKIRKKKKERQCEGRAIDEWTLNSIGL